jgi:hypothetical protein
MKIYEDGLITNGWNNAYLYGGWNSDTGEAADNYVECWRHER